jgi:hypothetical protein
LREALARSDNDFLVAEPRRKKPPARNHTFGALFAIGRFFRGLAGYPNRIAGALLVAIAAAITVNALELQTARHPAPFFSRAVAPPVATPTPAKTLSAAPLPETAARPQSPTPSGTDPLGQFIRGGETPAATPPAATPEPGRRPDAISQILRQAQMPAAAPEPSRAVFAAQKALMKLGYVLKPDGIEGEATRKAVLQYEADHHLLQRGELTAKLIRILGREANIAIP